MKEANVGLGETFIDIPAGSQEEFLSIKRQMLLCKKTNDGLVTPLNPLNPPSAGLFYPPHGFITLEEKTFVVFPLLFQGRGISSPGVDVYTIELLASKSLRKKNHTDQQVAKFQPRHPP